MSTHLGWGGYWYQRMVGERMIPLVPISLEHTTQSIQYGSLLLINVKQRANGREICMHTL